MGHVIFWERRLEPSIGLVLCALLDLVQSQSEESRSLANQITRPVLWDWSYASTKTLVDFINLHDEFYIGLVVSMTSGV